LRSDAVSLQGASSELTALLGVLTFPVFLTESDPLVHVSPVCPDLDTLEATSKKLGYVLALLESSLSWCSLCTSRSSSEFFTESLREAANLVRLEALAQAVAAGASLRLLGVLYEQHSSVSATRRSVSSLAKEFVLDSSRAAIASAAASVRPELAEFAALSVLQTQQHDPVTHSLITLALEERLSALESPQRLASVARTSNSSLENVRTLAASLARLVTGLMRAPSSVVLCGVRDTTVRLPSALAGPMTALFALDNSCVLAVPAVVAEYVEGFILGPWRLLSPPPSVSADTLASSLSATWGLLARPSEQPTLDGVEEALDAALALTL
jgi:hypothetical protein